MERSTAAQRPAPPAPAPATPHCAHRSPAGGTRLGMGVTPPHPHQPAAPPAGAGALSVGKFEQD